MKLRRFVLAALAVSFSAGASFAHGEGWTPRPFASQVQSDEPQAIRKDDSQLWVVERPQGELPIVDVNSKPKRKPASSWNKVWHPSQWFSSSKSKKK